MILGIIFPTDFHIFRGGNMGTQELDIALAGWWFGTWLLFFHNNKGCHPSHCRTHIFFKVVK